MASADVTAMAAGAAIKLESTVIAINSLNLKDPSTD